MDQSDRVPIKTLFTTFEHGLSQGFLSVISVSGFKPVNWWKKREESHSSSHKTCSNALIFNAENAEIKRIVYSLADQLSVLFCFFPLQGY